MRIGINGFGRIGKAIFRIAEETSEIDVVAINDIVLDPGNIAYQIKYDTLYGRWGSNVIAEGGKLKVNGRDVSLFNYSAIDDVPWSQESVDLVIDASGVLSNVLKARNAIEKHDLKRVLVTHSPDPVDCTIVLGANHEDYSGHEHQVISSSICDATAMGPVLKQIQRIFGIDSAAITTLHPWLNYQNLNDGPASSWSVPGEIYHHYALGRSSLGNMIPKPTSAITATCKVVAGLCSQSIISFSYRTPTAIVGSADITLNLSRPTTKEEVIRLFTDLERQQKWKIYHNNIEPLVSLDFLGSPYSAIIDHRWTEIVNGKLLKLVLWYDNEWGYANRVCDIAKFILENK